MDTLRGFLRARAEGDLLSWANQIEAMERFGLTCAEVEGAILEEGFLPARHLRNRWMLSTAQQRQLFGSKVAVVGCGGLGGYILEELARHGIGQLLTIYPNAFEERSRREEALSRVTAINPAVTVSSIDAIVTRDSATELFAGTDVVVDAIDNDGPTRFELAECCSKLGIPLVHGAISCGYGQVTTIFPGERTLQRLSSLSDGVEEVEAQVGKISFASSLVGSFEVAEVCKILLGTGRLLRNRYLLINLLQLEVKEISL